MNKKREESGFTLIEIIVMVAILGVLGVTISNIFITSLRSSIKSQRISELKEKGNSALSVMERMIREAKSIDSDCTAVGSVLGYIDITYKDDLQTRFFCGENAIASSSASIPGFGVYLIGDDDAPDINIIGCTNFITCTIGPGGIPEVEIKFTLEQGGKESGEESYDKTRIDFETKVIPRNY